MFLSMNNSNYMSNRNHFKDTGTFLSKKQFMPSHVTKNVLDDPKSSEKFCTLFYGFFLSKSEVSIFKNG